MKALLCPDEEISDLIYPTVRGNHGYCRRGKNIRGSEQMVSYLSVPVDYASLNTKNLNFNHHKDLCFFLRPNTLKWVQWLQKVQ